MRDARHVRFWQTIGSPTAVLIMWIIAGAAFAWLGVRDADQLYESMRAQMAPIDSQQEAEAPGLEQNDKPSAPPRVPKHDDGDNSEAIWLGFHELMSAPLTQNWTMTSDGPVLTDGFVRVGLELDATQIDEVKRILQAAYADYLKVEQRHLEQQTADDGHLTIAIKPHPEAVANLEDHLWTELDAVLDAEQQRIARLNLQLEPPEAAAGRALAVIVGPGFFGWGKDGAEIEIRQVGTWYHWKVKTRGYEYDTEMHDGEAPRLPEWLRRFWKEPHRQATSPRSDG